ncbi:hypothetical protein D3A96_15295 [Robertkochia marina]|nr:hypothetical protein D3A96_15295 [Robertkochia marina]
MGARLVAILWEVSAKKVKNFSSLIRLPLLKIDYKKVPSALRMTHNGRAMHWRGWLAWLTFGPFALEEARAAST